MVRFFFSLLGTALVVWYICFLKYLFDKFIDRFKKK